jgi:hypothetical protein
VGEILGWVENQFFYLRNSKKNQKSLSRFVLTFCRRAFLKIFQNGGTIQERIFYSLFSKIWQKSTNKDFSILQNDFYKKILNFFGKNKKLKKKSKMTAKNHLALGNFFLNRNPTETSSSDVLKIHFLMRICL